jgi:hypothetical protein
VDAFATHNNSHRRIGLEVRTRHPRIEPTPANDPANKAQANHHGDNEDRNRRKKLPNRIGEEKREEGAEELHALPENGPLEKVGYLIALGRKLGKHFFVRLFEVRGQGTGVSAE